MNISHSIMSAHLNFIWIVNRYANVAILKSYLIQFICAVFIEQVEFPTDFCVSHEKNFPLEHDSTLKK